MRHLLIVGVSKYEHSSNMSLPGVAEDVNRLRQVMTNHLGDIGLASIDVLEDHEATRIAILKSIGKMSKAKYEDQVIVYFGGHAHRDSETDALYFLPYEATFKSATTRGISMSELANRLIAVRASEIVLIFDCCHGEGFNEAHINYLKERIKGRKKCFVIAASYRSEKIRDYDSGGLLVAYLAEALEGLSGVQRSNGGISIQAAFQYAETMIKALPHTERLYQSPVMLAEGGTIILSYPPAPDPPPPPDDLVEVLRMIRIAFLAAPPLDDLIKLKLRADVILLKYPSNIEALELKAQIEKAIKKGIEIKENKGTVGGYYREPLGNAPRQLRSRQSYVALSILVVLAVLALIIWRPWRSVQALNVDAEGFIPSGWMGDAPLKDAGGNTYAKLDPSDFEPHSGSSCWELEYRPGPNQFAAISWQYPENNWGEKPGKNLSKKGFQRVSVWARALPDSRGKFPTVQFKAGGGTDSNFRYQASFEAQTGDLKLTREWKQYSINLSGKDLSQVISAFTVVVRSLGLGNEGSKIFLDDIEYR